MHAIIGSLIAIILLFSSSVSQVNFAGPGGSFGGVFDAALNYLSGTVSDGCAEWSGNQLTSTGSDCSSGGSFGQAWELATNTFSQSALAPTTTQNIHVSGTGTSTFSGGLEAWRQIAAPYFHATSTSQRSVFDDILAVDATLTNVIISGDTINDFAGTGLTVTGNALTTTLGTSVDLTSEVTGTLPVGNGGTGITSCTNNYVVTGGTTYNCESALQFNGSTLTVNVNGSAAAVDITQAGSGTSFNINNSGSGDFFVIDTSDFVVTNNGDVGIDDATPDASLEIVDRGIDILNLSSAAGNDGDYVTVDTSGNFGIGTTSPFAKFSVNPIAGDSWAFAVGSSTQDIFRIQTTGTIYAPQLTSALLQTGSNGAFAEYAGTSCTNQFVRALSALGIATCASVATTDITNDSILEIDLDVTNTPTDNYVLTYDSGTGGFTWEADQTGGTSFGQAWNVVSQNPSFIAPTTTTSILVGTTTIPTNPTTAAFFATTTNATSILDLYTDNNALAYSFSGGGGLMTLYGLGSDNRVLFDSTNDWNFGTDDADNFFIYNVTNDVTALRAAADGSRINLHSSANQVEFGLSTGNSAIFDYSALSADRTLTLRDAAGTVILSGDTFTGDVTGTLDTDGSTALAIGSGVIIEPDLSADNSPSDGDYLQYDSTGTNFVWRTAANLVSDISSALNTAITTLSNLTTVGALNAGSITSGFGNIDIGSSNLDADGTITFAGLSDGLVRATSGVLSGAGTISNADWSGTDLSVANGGTGASTLTDGAVVFGNGTGAVDTGIPAFTITHASSTQNAATSTKYLGVAPYALTVTEARCDFSNFMGISLYDGTNRANYFEASSTVGVINFTTNNTFTQYEVIRVDVGTSTAISADVRGACTFFYQKQ